MILKTLEQTAALKRHESLAFDELDCSTVMYRSNIVSLARKSDLDLFNRRLCDVDLNSMLTADLIVMRVAIVHKTHFLLRYLYEF